MVYGAAVTPPQLGFAQNIGQYDSDVLFALGDQIFYRNKVQLTYSLSIRFVNANPSATAVGKDLISVPLNLYLGSDPRRWREDVPHFGIVRYAQVYPGIDAEWNSGRSGTATVIPLLRMVVAPGANPQQLRLGLEMVGNLDWTISGGWVIVRTAGGLTFDRLAAHQPVGSTRLQVPATFVKVDESSFRPEVGTYDPALPLVIEIGWAPYAFLSVSTARPGYDDAAVLAGTVFYYPSTARRAYVAAVSPNGNPVFLSLFDGLFQELRPNWLVAGRNGDITAGGAVDWTRGFPPVTTGAPRPEGRPGGLPEGWVGRFDGRGRLRAATLTGDALGALAVDPDGVVYFATADSVIRWVPGAAQFGFTAPLRSVSSLSANSSGGLAFAAAQTDGQPTTPGAYKKRYEGPWDLYVGVLDRLSGSIRMATYVPMIGRTSSPFTSRSSVVLAAGGNLWIGSAFRFQDYPGGDAFTLVAVSADGARELRSESVPAFPEVAFDSRGQVLAVVSTYWPNLPTDADAPRRAGCYSDYNLHLRTLAPNGTLLNTTYLPGAGRIIAFDGPDRLFVNSAPYYWELDLKRVDTSPPANPGIACAIHTASRQPRTSLARGGLSTLVSNQLGPLEQATAALDGSGRLPLTLAGVQVLINQVPAPLVSVQQGLITFYTPEDTPRGSAALEVRWRGALVASTALSITDGPDFGILTADGSGRGLAAALNQDGTVNGPNHPAKWGSVVVVFGTGPLQASVPVLVGGLRATVEYAGPAPGAVPGVTQINFRLPYYSYLSSGWVAVSTGAGQYSPGVRIIYVSP